MATLSIRPGNTPGYEIRFVDYRNRRKTIYLGGRKYSQQTANELKTIVEVLVYNQNNFVVILDARTSKWIETASPEIRKKLGQAGLIEAPQSHTLREMWDTFLKQKTGVKESTLNQYEHAKNRFFAFFKESELIDAVSKDRLTRWKQELLQTLQSTTVASQLKHTKTVFTWAVQAGWIEKSPLDGIGRGSFVNREKDRIITMEEYRRLLDACPCRDWRVIISLARIGGLRCPSEVIGLRWAEVNWDRGCFFVRSPKTEHKEGKESRLVPIFPELRKELEALYFNLAGTPEIVEHVINRYRDPKQNLGTTFSKIALKAGLGVISRPFDNMRMTRSNEVYNRFGAFKESQWIGHSSRVRTDHYLMITDADYQEASQWNGPSKREEFPTRIPTSKARKATASSRKSDFTTPEESAVKS